MVTTKVGFRHTPISKCNTAPFMCSGSTNPNISALWDVTVKCLDLIVEVTRILCYLRRFGHEATSVN